MELLTIERRIKFDQLREPCVTVALSAVQTALPAESFSQTDAA